jgi:oligopeptide/dipeptide ABC transporter ATP-binding protein
MEAVLTKAEVVPTPVFRVRNLHVGYKLKGAKLLHAVQGVDFEIYRKETVGIVGESGSGKSATGLAMMRLLPDNGKIMSGQVILGDTDLTTLTEDSLGKFRGEQISMVFQDPMSSLNPVFTIGSQLEDTIRVHDPSMSKDKRREMAIEQLRLLGIPGDRLEAYPHQLSGGMRQRVMIALSIVRKPKILIADEPTSNLDVTIQAQILDLLTKLKSELDISIILISHDLNVVSLVADRIIVMYLGNIVEIGPTCDVLCDPKHPYTEGLLKLSERQKQADGFLTSIPGSSRDKVVGSWDVCCPYEHRCAKKMAICSSQGPPNVEIAPGYRVRCFLYENKGGTK